MANHKDYGEALHEHQEVFRRFPLVPVRGVPLMEPIAEQWDPIENFEARPDDLLISTYPKAGTTWMQEIVDLICAGGNVEKARRAPTHIRIPFLEICSPPPMPSGVDSLVNAPSPRVIKTHLPFQLVPKSFLEKNCKIIYVARNAKDNLVSYYFFDRMNLTQPDPGPWDGYVKKFMEGTVAWGSWYDHVRRYWDERGNYPILYVFYEDMKEGKALSFEGKLYGFPLNDCGPAPSVPNAMTSILGGVIVVCALEGSWTPPAKAKDLAREVRRVMDFLEIDLPEDAVQKITHHTSFQTMKDNPMSNYSTFPDVIFDKKIGSFMRKGEVGDWKNYFTVAQREVFDADYLRRMEGTSLHFRDVL